MQEWVTRFRFDIEHFIGEGSEMTEEIGYTEWHFPKNDLR